jgi:3'(2'), 5'-bisphosphate nucleotidase
VTDAAGPPGAPPADPTPLGAGPGADGHDDHTLARVVADHAGEALLALRQRLVDGGTTSWELEAQGDRLAHELIVGRLAEARPDDEVLSEEGVDNRRRLGTERVWIVDPLDGTSEFGSPPRPDWAVHVALTRHGEMDAAAVALPAMGITLGTDEPPEMPPAPDGPVRVVCSRWHPSAAAQVVASGLDGRLLAMGSAGAKAMAVVLGHADVYAHSGGQYEWDNCAPAAVAKAAGFHTSRIDGSELRYNNASVYLPDFLICRPELAERCLELLARAMARSRLWTPHDDW